MGITFKNLRLVDARLLAHYLLQRPYLLNNWKWINGFDGNGAVALGQDQILYHAWLPGFATVRAASAERLRELISGAATPDTSEKHRRLTDALGKLGWIEDAELDMEALLRKVRESFFAWQNPRELGPFLELVREKRPKAVLEIGTSAGGVFYCLSQVADPEAVMVSMDLQGLPFGGGQTNMECDVYRTFGPATQRFEFIRQRSFHHSSIRKLERILEGRKLDVLFIDADHSYGGSRSDFELYRPFVADDGLIAFHDIVEFPESMGEWRVGNEVAIFWKEVAQRYRTQTFVDDSPLLTPSRSGEAVESRWPALGIGVVLGTEPVQTAG